jgi:hypothetical protein
MSALEQSITSAMGRVSPQCTEDAKAELAQLRENSDALADALVRIVRLEKKIALLEAFVHEYDVPFGDGTGERCARAAIDWIERE